MAEKAPAFFDSSLYKWTGGMVDAEDVLAGLSLPMLQYLSGKSFRFRYALQGFINQMATRYVMNKTVTDKTDPANAQAINAVVIGALTSLESALMTWKMPSVETIVKESSIGSLASVLSASVGKSWISPKLPAYTR